MMPIFTILTMCASFSLWGWQIFKAKCCKDGLYDVVDEPYHWIWTFSDACINLENNQQPMLYRTNTHGWSVQHHGSTDFFLFLHEQLANILRIAIKRCLTNGFNQWRPAAQHLKKREKKRKWEYYRKNRGKKCIQIGIHT